MKLQQAKEFYALGAVKSISASKDTLTKDWALLFLLSNDTAQYLETATGKKKLFTSANTMIGEVEQITGKTVSLRFY